MSKFCSFCSKSYTLRLLSSVSNIKSKVKIKLKDSFNIEIDTDKFTEICKDCEEKLEISWNFYKQVFRAQKIHLDCIVKDEIVESSSDRKDSKKKASEIKKTFNSEKIVASSSKVSAEDISSVVVKEEYESSCIFFNETYHPDEIEAKVENLKPSKVKKADVLCKSRSKSRGVKKQKSIQCITMLSEFEDEIKRQNFFQAPEVLENLEENPRLWSDFEWKCSECKEIFGSLVEMDVHLKKSHRHKQYHGTCSYCLKETFRICTFKNHIIREHHNNLKFCCVACSEYKESLIELYNHHQSAHKSFKILFCLYCGLNFGSGANLRDHMITAHNRTDNIELLECDICGRQTLLKTQMAIHMKAHKPPEFHCDQW